MPVQFKSEYTQNFNSFENENSNFVAGVDSDKLGVTHEPPIQHKRRIGGPPTSLSTQYFTAPVQEEDFTLLGSHDKFSENVRYKPKHATLPGKMYKNKENLDSPPNKQIRMRKRVLKPQAKERAPRVVHSPRNKDQTKVESSATKESVIHNRDSPKESEKLSPPDAPRDLPPRDELKEALRGKFTSDVTTNKRRESDKTENVEQNNNNRTMNEITQTNMGKNITDSVPEAPAEFSLKYKAGVAPNRPIKRSSEYQKQFQWKSSVKASPLLAAQQMLYKNQADLGPYKHDLIFKETEYQRQFQHWRPPAAGFDFFNNINNLHNGQPTNGNAANKTVALRNETSGKTKQGMKRSKSAGAVLRQEQQESDSDDEMKYKLKSHMQQAKRKIRKLGSEYRANFKAPTRYSYIDGAWRGADPPQLIPQASDNENVDLNNNSNESNNNQASRSKPLNNWFAEVLELRRRAEEYRKRAQGTHFSREHLLQLMAKQNNYWDIQADSSPSIQALNLESTKLLIPRESEFSMKDKNYSFAIDNVEPSRVSVESKRENKNKKTRQSRKMAWLEEQKVNLSNQRKQLEEAEKERQRHEDGEDLATQEDEDEEGRLPTPVLKSQTDARRHHLDLTTPAVGGALLTHPPSKLNKLLVTSRSGDSYVTASDDFSPPKLTRKYDVDTLVTAPTLGMASTDTHDLRDDDASSDRPLNTKYFSSPGAYQAAVSKSNEPTESNSSGKQQRSSHKQQQARPSQLTAIKEGFGQTYVQSGPNFAEIKKRFDRPEAARDDDVMSVSLMSVASSASLASQVLERTKKRQQEFWGENKSS